MVKKTHGHVHDQNDDLVITVQFQMYVQIHVYDMEEILMVIQFVILVIIVQRNII